MQIQFSTELVRVYSDQLAKRGLTNKAKNQTSSGAIGGGTLKDTFEHFCHRYLAGCARMQWLVSGQTVTFRPSAENIWKVFSSGVVSQLDIPAGCGASAISLLCSLAVLRSQRVLPPLALNVNLAVGDISQDALTILQEQIDSLKPFLASQGIAVFTTSAIWNAESVESTNALFDFFIRLNPAQREFVVTVGNFSGELSSKSDLSSFAQRIIERMSPYKGALFWIEPALKQSLLEKWWRSIKNLLSKLKLAEITANDLADQYDEFEWFCPLKQKPIVGRLQVVFDLRFEKALSQ